MNTLARVAAVTVLVAGSIVACSDGTPACAATSGKPAPRPYRPSKPSGQRTTSKVQDKPRATQAKPTNWGGYNQRVQKRNWATPYRSGYPTAPRPVIVQHYGHDYRTYPGYTGYYPVGVWPIGYGDRYGCQADQEGQGQQ